MDRMDRRELGKLISFLRANGVVSYSKSPLSLVLGDKPVGKPRGRAAKADDGEPDQEMAGDPRFFLERIAAANNRKGR